MVSGNSAYKEWVDWVKKAYPSGSNNIHPALKRGDLETLDYLIFNTSELHFWDGTEQVLYTGEWLDQQMLRRKLLGELRKNKAQWKLILQPGFNR